MLELKSREGEFLRPLVSVLLPVYNGEKYLKEAIESVLNQTLTNFELVIVDDGSIDLSKAIIKKYAKNDSRVILIEQENQGIVRALNKALNLAKGKFSARMDADDVCIANRLELQSSFLEAHDEVVVVGGNCYTIDEDGDRIGTISVLSCHEDINSCLLRGKNFGDLTHLVHPAVMFRTDSAREIGGYSDKFLWAEDRDFFLKLGEVGKLANLNDFVLYYRFHSDSVSMAKASIQQESAYRAIVEALNRRRLTEMPELQMTRWSAVSTAQSWLDNSAMVAISAANNGFSHTARKHAIRIFRARPFHIKTWKTLVLAFVSRSILDKLFFLKQLITRI